MQITSPAVSRSLPVPNLILSDLAWEAPYLLGIDAARSRILAIDTWSGQTEGATRMVRKDVSAIAFGKGLLWQASESERLVFAVDLSDNKVVHQVPFPVSMVSVQGLDIGDDKLWLGDPSTGNLIAIDMASGVLKHVYSLDRYVSGVACGQAGVFFSETGSGIVGCIQSDTGSLVRLYEVIGQPASLVCVQDRLWYVDREYGQITELLL